MVANGTESNGLKRIFTNKWIWIKGIAMKCLGHLFITTSSNSYFSNKTELRELRRNVWDTSLLLPTVVLISPIKPISSSISKILTSSYSTKKDFKWDSNTCRKKQRHTIAFEVELLYFDTRCVTLVANCVLWFKSHPCCHCFWQPEANSFHYEMSSIFWNDRSCSRFVKISCLLISLNK